MKIFNSSRKNTGVSLIALVITIIVVIILASIAFNSSTNTVSKANYSKFVTNITEVQDALNTTTVTVKGSAMASGLEITDAQAFNYVAKGGKTENDFLPEKQIPNYTIIETSADIGIELPVIKVNTNMATGVKVKYATTKSGKVFIWPPYQYENEYYTTSTNTVPANIAYATGNLEISIDNKNFIILVDENGILQNTNLSSGDVVIPPLESGDMPTPSPEESGDDEVIETPKINPEILAKLQIGQYVNYTPTSANNISSDPSKTGASAEIMSTNTSIKWRILDINEQTGKAILTTNGYVNNLTIKGYTGYFGGVSELNRLCAALYSNTSKNITARSMTIEDLDRACNFTPSGEAEQVRYAWYPAGTPSSDLVDITIGDKVYIARKHESNLDGITYPRFYNWDDRTTGITHISTDENDYVELKSKEYPILITRTMCWYNPSDYNPTIGNILKGDEYNRGWLASTYVYVAPEGYGAGYGLRTAFTNNVFTYDSYHSAGNIISPSYGLRPVVEIDANLLNVLNTTADGTASKPWNINW